MKAPAKPPEAPHPLPCSCVLEAWDAHEGELRGWLLGRTRDQDLADDLLADVFLRAIRSGDRFCEVQQARAWLFTVARNRLIDHVRTTKRTTPVPDSLAASEVEGPQPVETLATCLPRALTELDPRDADVLQRCDLEGMTQVEYARQHQISVPGAKSRLQRARRRLKAHLITVCQVRTDESGAVCCFVPRGSAEAAEG